MMTHPAIREAVALTTAAGITLFWVPAATAAVLPMPEDLSAFGAQRLESRLVPAQFFALGAVPRTPTARSTRMHCVH